MNQFDLLLESTSLLNLMENSSEQRMGMQMDALTKEKWDAM